MASITWSSPRRPRSLVFFRIVMRAAGGVATASPGPTGAVSAALTAICAFAWSVAPLVPSMWEPTSNPGEVYSENLGTLIALTTMFCAVLPLVVLSGYLSMRVGGRLRNGLRRSLAGMSGT